MLGSGWTAGTRPGGARSSTPSLLALREILEQVEVDDDLLGYVVDADATRAHPQVQVGASPRGCSRSLTCAGQAVMDGRDYVTPEDVKAVAVPALAHRITLRPELWVRDVSGVDIVAEPAPRGGPRRRPGRTPRRRLRRDGWPGSRPPACGRAGPRRPARGRVGPRAPARGRAGLR